MGLFFMAFASNTFAQDKKEKPTSKTIVIYRITNQTSYLSITNELLIYPKGEVHMYPT